MDIARGWVIFSIALAALLGIALAIPAGWKARKVKAAQPIDPSRVIRDLKRHLKPAGRQRVIEVAFGICGGGQAGEIMQGQCQNFDWFNAFNAEFRRLAQLPAVDATNGSLHCKSFNTVCNIPVKYNNPIALMVDYDELLGFLLNNSVHIVAAHQRYMALGGSVRYSSFGKRTAVYLQTLNHYGQAYREARAAQTINH